jgi:hypothetical protein
MVTDPDARPAAIAPDFANLVIVIAQTGDEWSTSGQLVEQYILPLLRKHNIRLVEVARSGPTKKDGITVLQDTRQPQRLHLDGVFKLSDENRATGTMPQLGGVRKCSQKAKGSPQDMWRANEFGNRQYFHAIGFNRDLCRRFVTCPLSAQARGPPTSVDRPAVSVASHAVFERRPDA